MERKSYTDPKEARFRRIPIRVNVGDRLEQQRRQMNFERVHQAWRGNQVEDDKLRSADNNRQMRPHQNNMVFERVNIPRLFLDFKYAIVMALFVILVLLAYHVWDSDCYQQYQSKECSLKSNSKECGELYDCIKRQEDPNYKEYLLTLVAGSLLLLKKYEVEIREIYRRGLN